MSTRDLRGYAGRWPDLRWPGGARVALQFGAPEYFALIVLGLLVSISLAHGSVTKALAMICLGLLLGTVGQDIYTGTPRFTLGIREYADGLNFVAVAVGVFGIAEILRNLESEKTRTVLMAKVSNLMPSREDFKAMVGPVERRPWEPRDPLEPWE